MIQTKKIERIQVLGELKQQHIDQTTAPLDGMWLCGFVPKATHYGFFESDRLAGFCCVNDDGYLLQFHICPQFYPQAQSLFAAILTHETQAGQINGAFVSTAEPQFLSLCLDQFTQFKVNALMYQLGNCSVSSVDEDRKISLTPIEMRHLDEAVAFVKSGIGCSKEDWLVEYFSNLIRRGELFGYWRDEALLASGESRGYDEFQCDYADLGVIVDKSVRGRGIATRVLTTLAAMTLDNGLIPICSTERDNIAAQKAISRAGFFPMNRIIQFENVK